MVFRVGRFSRDVALGILLLGQVVLVLGLAVCVVLRPGLVVKRDESGVSNYGIHLRTAVPYSLALVGAGASSLIVGLRHRLPRSDRALLVAYGTLMGGELLSTYPYRVNEAWHTLHLAMGFALVAFEFLSVWWWGTRSRFPLRWWGVAVETVGLALALATLAAVVHALFLAEVLTSVSWGAVMMGRVREVS